MSKKLSSKLEQKKSGYKFAIVTTIVNLITALIALVAAVIALLERLLS